MVDKLTELLKHLPQVNHFEAQVQGMDYVFRCTAEYLIANGVTIPVRCKDCIHWVHMEDGMGDCTNRRFHLDGHANPTMKKDDFCSCGERRTDERL